MTKDRFNRYFSRFAFVQTSSFLMFFGINLSFLFFVHLFFSTAARRLGTLFRLNSWLKVMIVLFMVGATLGTVHNFWEGNDSAYLNSLRVLPNYIYWGLLMLLFAMFAAHSVIDYARVFRAVSFSIVVVLTYYLLFQDYIANDMFLKYFFPNNISLLLICYSPYLVYYTRRHVHPAVAVLLLAVLLFAQLEEGRRAGFILVLLGGMSAYFVSLFKFNSVRKLMRPIAVSLVVLGLLNIGPVESLIQGQSERVHQLIYASRSDYLSEDRSHLTRQAMLEKGFALLEDNVLFGVGLNNFTKVEVSVVGDFEGSEYVVDKDIFRRISSHNSYINILAEGGLALAIPFGGILSILLFKGLRYFGRLKDPEKVIVISFCAMCVHLYFTNGIVNSLVWFNIGLLAYVVSQPRHSIQQSYVRAGQST